MNGCIGIDITAQGVKLALLSRRRGTRIVLGTWAKDLPAGEAPESEAGMGALLDDALHDVPLRASAEVVVGLPLGKVFYHSLRTEMDRREDVSRIVKFELEDDFPVAFDDLVIDICGHRQTGEREHEYLIAAVHRGEIDVWNRFVTHTGRKCSRLTADVCALETVARAARFENDDVPRVLLYADGARAILGILRQGTLLGARHFPCTGVHEVVLAALALEIELMYRDVLGRQCRQTSRIVLSGPDELVGRLSGGLAEATGREVQVLDLSSVVRPPEGIQLDGQFTVAVGLALMGLTPAGQWPNFLNADTSHADLAIRSKVKRTALVAAVLLAVILGLVGAKAIRALNSLEAQRANIGREIRTLFLDAFPQEKKIVNELAQMTEQVGILQKERDTLAGAMGQQSRPMRVLHILSEKLASDKGIAISTFSIKDGIVHVTGVGSFDAAEQFIEELRHVSEFRSVEMEDMGQSRGGDRPEFRLLIKMKAE